MYVKLFLFLRNIEEKVKESIYYSLTEVEQEQVITFCIIILVINFTFSVSSKEAADIFFDVSVATEVKFIILLLLSSWT